MAPSSASRARRSRGRLRTVAVGGLCALSALLATACGSSPKKTSTASAAVPSHVTIAGATISRNAALNAMLPSSLRSGGQVTVGEDPTEAPWGYYSPPGSHNWTGAEYSLGQALAAELGIRFVVNEQLFTGLIPGMLAGKYQVGLANLGDRKDREQSLNFVDYLLDGDGLLVVKGNPHHIVSLKDLCGLPIAITAGSTFLTYAQSQNKSMCGAKPYTILTFPSDADSFLAVKSGKAVATLTDIAEAAYVAQTSGAGSLYQAVHDPSAPQGYAVAWIGMAVSKQDPQLAHAMLAAQKALVKSGAERTILSHYGLGFFAGTPPKLNACATPNPDC